MSHLTYPEYLQFIDENFQNFLALHPTLEDLKAFRKSLPNRSEIVPYQRKFLAHATTSQDFLALIAAPGNQHQPLPANYETEHSKLIESAVDDFLKLDPSFDQLMTYKNEAFNPKEAALVQKKLLSFAKTPAEFLALAIPSRKVSISLSADQKPFKTAISEMERSFRSLNPTEEELKQFKKIAITLDPDVEPTALQCIMKTLGRAFKN